MCLFCKIVKKEIPADVVLEDNNFLAFRDIAPKAPEHILCIPKNHIESFNDVSGEDMAGMTKFIQATTKKLNIDAKGYRVITNIGDDGGQEVKHLHFHILGGAKLKWENLT